MYTKKPKKFTHIKVEVGLYKELQKKAKKLGISMGTLLKFQNDYPVVSSEKITSRLK